MLVNVDAQTLQWKLKTKFKNIEKAIYHDEVDVISGMSE